MRSVSIDFGIVTDPTTDWGAVGDRLDEVNATTVNLNAGRVEFTAFDWPAHPESAAEPGTDHIALAARRLQRAGGADRQINLIVDTYVPQWITSDPTIAGVDAKGRRSVYTASVAQLAQGPVGDRLVAYVAALGLRYQPNSIEVTELFVDSHTFGPADLALFGTMTGATDWPRTASGEIDPDAPSLGHWRSQVLADLMGRMRTALDDLPGVPGEDIELVLDVRVNWLDPTASRPLSGHDYRILLRQPLRLQLWLYTGLAGRGPGDVEAFTAALRAGGFDLARFTASVGLWRGKPDAEPAGRLTPAELTAMVVAAQTNGVADVNVTPYSLMTPDLWAALAQAWTRGGPAAPR